MTFNPTPKEPAPREPNYLDGKRSDLVNARAVDLDIALAQCGRSYVIDTMRDAIRNLTREILAEMLKV